MDAHERFRDESRVQERMCRQEFECLAAGLRDRGFPTTNRRAGVLVEYPIGSCTARSLIGMRSNQVP